MIQEAIYNVLKDDAGVAAVVSTRIYPLKAPQNVTAPFITYQKITGGRYRGIDGPLNMASPRFQIDCYAATYLAAKNLADLVRQALDGYKGTKASTFIASASLESEQEIYDDETEFYRVISDYFILHEE